MVGILRLSGVIVKTVDLSENKLKIYPNPTSGEIFIEKTQPNALFTEGVLSVDIFDIYGRLVEQYKTEKGFDIVHLPRGLYLFSIKNKDFQYSIKVSKID